MKQFTLACIAAVSSAFTVGDIEFTSIGTFKQKEAAFIQMTSFEGSEEFLMFTAFSGTPWAKGSVSIVPGVKEAVVGNDVSGLEGTKLDTGDISFKWPNDAKVIPADVFDGQRAIVVPDGFLVPGHKNGGVYVISMDDSDITKTTGTVKISPDKDDYFYHMGEWIDLNGDGRKDFITARSNAKAGEGELVWFEHPEGGLSQTPWTEHVVTKGPDVSISVDTFPQFPNELVIWAAQFFDETVAVYRVSTEDGTLVDSRVIDDSTILSAYQATRVDLNGDGKQQLLVNNHEKDEKTNGVFAYTIPDDIMTGSFEKFTLADDFKNAFNLFVPGMSPGFPYAAYPNGKKDGERAHILIAGDGDYSAHLLTPTGDASKFEYQKDLIVNAHGTVGALATADLDGDGWLEMYMPNYDKGYVEVYKMSAASATEFLQ